MLTPERWSRSHRGETYIYRVPSAEIQLAREKKFQATADYWRIAAMDAVIICVPIPLDEQREPDLSCITSTAEALSPHLRAGQLIALESTTYPGTTEEVFVPILEKNPGGLRASRRPGKWARQAFYVAFSPSAKILVITQSHDAISPRWLEDSSRMRSDLAAALYSVHFQAHRPGFDPRPRVTKLLENSIAASISPW